MTIWTPEPLEDGSGPLYLGIVDALAADIRAGRLPPGSRLPPHRDLARRLAVNVGTVTRAYREAAARGLVDGEVGRGTFVRHRETPLRAALNPSVPPRAVNLSFNLPVGGVTADDQRAALARLATRSDRGDLFGHYHLDGVDRHRETGKAWLHRLGLSATAERTLVTTGAQQGMALALSATAHAGDLVLAAAQTYPGLRVLADQLHLRLAGLPMDGEGILPDEFDRACEHGDVRALYVMPTIQNPTGAVMSAERRHAIVATARRHDVALIEDDTYAFLHPDPPPRLASLAPERTWYTTSFAKCLAAGLRVGVTLVPEASGGELERVLAGSGGSGWLASPLTAELAMGWVLDGTLERCMHAKREECAERQAMARVLLDAADSPSAPTSSHLWLPLPEPWRSEDFVARARAAQVVLSAPSSFVVGRAPAPHAVRVCVGTPPDRETLRAGLTTLAELLAGAPRAGCAIL